MKSIAILLTVFNRRKQTISCLERVYCQSLNEGYKFDVYLTDDGSTDGTSETVKEQFPSIHVIKGDGNLYWNRGMYVAWEKAAKTNDYDYYLWLNDDTLLYEKALSSLIDVSEKQNNHSIVVGTTCAIGNQDKITYGGRTIHNKLIIPTDKVVLCDYFNGNIVLIPRYAYKLVGMNDPTFHHAIGDFDYGLRAAKIGVKSVVAPYILGECNTHESLPIWCNPNVSFTKRWKVLHTPLGQNPKEHFIYEKRHFGILKASFHYITIHLRVCFPKLWIKR